MLSAPTCTMFYMLHGHKNRGMATFRKAKAQPNQHSYDQPKQYSRCHGLVWRSLCSWDWHSYIYRG